MRLLIAQPHGFCAGVSRAVEIVELALKACDAPLYVKHEIVHNRLVVESFKKRGVIFTDKVENIPKGATAVFSAHGSPPEDYQKAKERELDLMDATCPLVAKVHLEAKRYARERMTIILIGHKKHVEVKGISAEAPEKVIVVENMEEAEKVQPREPQKVAYLTQTTLSVDETRDIIAVLKKRFPDIVEPPSKDICYATTNRQQAVKKVAAEADLVLVIGSKNSSNSNRLRETAEAAGSRAYLIDGANDIDLAWLKGVATIGLTAGASAPEESVRQVIDFLRSHGVESVEEVVTADENMRFPLPAELASKNK